MPTSRKQKVARSMRKAFGSEKGDKDSPSGESMVDRVSKLLWGPDTDDLGTRIGKSAKRAKKKGGR